MVSNRSWAAQALSLGLPIGSLILLSDIGRAGSGLHVTGNGSTTFTITTFASGFTYHVGGSGPSGVAYRTGGTNYPEFKLLVTDVNAGSGCTVYLLGNNDNQNTPPSNPSNMPPPYPVATTYPNLDAFALAQIQVGNEYKYYLGQGSSYKIIEVDNDGIEVRPIVSFTDGSPHPVPLGIAPYPPTGAVGGLTGHLFVSAGADIWDVDPGPAVPPPPISFNHSASATPDGLTIDPPGTTIYAAYSDGFIRGYDMATHTLTWTSAFIGGGPDGVAIGVGTLTGYIYVNTNSGDVWELGVPSGTHAGVKTMIATGGSRGDFVMADPNIYSGSNYPSLLLVQTDCIMRLDPPGGGFFAPPTSSLDPVLCTTCFPRLCEPGTGGVNPCPCANGPIGPGRGCNNFGPNPTGGSGGASVDASGTASIANDLVSLQITDEVSNASNVTVLWQGTGTLAAGAQAGAGVRCVNGSLKRLYKGNASAGAITFPSGAQPNVHTASALKGFTIAPPVTLYYYASYRNSAAGTPCGSSALGFNATNAAAISWTP